MKDYKAMTQEQLEEELFKIYEKNNLEYYNDNMTEKYPKLRSCTEVGMFGTDIDNLIMILRTMHDKPDLRRFYPDKKRILIHPYDKAFKTDEPVHEDFITRQEFINRTGIFVTPIYFDMVYDEFKETNISVDEFVNGYEEKYSTCIQHVSLNGIFKYEIQDDEVSCIGIHNSIHEPNIWEIVDSLAMAYYHKWLQADDLAERYRKIIEDQQKVIEKLKKSNGN